MVSGFLEQGGRRSQSVWESFVVSPVELEKRLTSPCPLYTLWSSRTEWLHPECPFLFRSSRRVGRLDDPSERQVRTRNPCNSGVV